MGVYLNQAPGKGHCVSLSLHKGRQIQWLQIKILHDSTSLEHSLF